MAVLGAAGALGHSVVAEALRRGCDVAAVVRRPPPVPLPDGARTVLADAGDPDALADAVTGATAVLHCVNVPLEQWADRLLPILGSAVAGANRAGARFVFPANVWVYGPRGDGARIDESAPPAPTSRKGRLRAEAEALVRAQATRFAMVRLPEFYGPNVANPLMGGPFRAALAGRRLTWMGPELDASVEYVYMPDAARAMLEVALAGDTDGATFHLPGAAATTPRAFLTEIARAAGIPARVRSMPAWLLRAIALGHAPAREFADILHLWTHPVLLDGARYERRFGALPATPYPDGIAATLDWFRRHPQARNAN